MPPDLNTPKAMPAKPRPGHFTEVQRAFAGHIRDPKRRLPPADVDPTRMAIYRDLFFNNLSSLLGQGFPVLQACLGQAGWDALIRQFLIEHRATTAFFPQLGQELVAFLSDERQPQPNDPAFLLELAHYEWVEAALLFSDDEATTDLADPNGDLLTGMPLVSPLAWNLSYRFPVHRIGPEFQPQEPDPEPTHLVVYRNRRDEVEFLKINPVTQRLLQLLKAGSQPSGLECLKTIAEELQHPEPDRVIQFGAGLLVDLRERQILLGTRR
ncbi:MAG: putative DNA-binding domain-containing protein [Lamprobacter sp.]|uniref:HvfC family RiPP maturation protein n=1 Tax=Lamprobacter sp. TaxID=3100796 RepID=UPI002B26385A|nr:putative DNA-binding domain-containing protein [Lamprobacter sp.]MEA3639111.1 putative DNA-binding domain-containing protein [Lamprobacter sp.]